MTSFKLQPWMCFLMIVSRMILLSVHFGLASPLSLVLELNLVSSASPRSQSPTAVSHTDSARSSIVLLQCTYCFCHWLFQIDVHTSVPLVRPVERLEQLNKCHSLLDVTTPHPLCPHDIFDEQG